MMLITVHYHHYLNIPFFNALQELCTACLIVGTQLQRLVQAAATSWSPRRTLESFS